MMDFDWVLSRHCDISSVLVSKNEVAFELNNLITGCYSVVVIDQPNLE